MLYWRNCLFHLGLVFLVEPWLGPYRNADLLLGSARNKWWYHIVGLLASGNCCARQGDGLGMSIPRSQFNLNANHGGSWGTNLSTCPHLRTHYWVASTAHTEPFSWSPTTPHEGKGLVTFRSVLASREQGFHLVRSFPTMPWDEAVIFPGEMLFLRECRPALPLCLKTDKPSTRSSLFCPQVVMYISILNTRK